MKTYTIHSLFTMKNGKAFQSESQRSYYAEDDGGIDRTFLPNGDYIVRNNQTGEVLEYRIAGSGVICPTQRAADGARICPNCHDKLFCAMCGEHVER